MKKIIKYLLVLIILTLILFFVFKIYSSIHQKKTIQNNIQTLPIAYLKSIQISSTTIKPTIIFNYFNPSCDHCQYMAKQFFKHKNTLQNICLIMVTTADINSIIQFKKDYFIDSLPNTIIIKDTNDNFYKTFAVSVVPSFFIYKNNVLIKKYIGETKIENLFEN